MRSHIIKSFLYYNQINVKTNYCGLTRDFKTVIEYKGLKHRAFRKTPDSLIICFNKLLYWCEEGPFKDQLTPKWNKWNERHQVN